MVGRQRGFAAMARVALALMLMVCLMPRASSPAQASDYVYGDLLYVATDLLNLRSEPNTTSEIREVLEYGELVSVLGGPRTGGGHVWYRVSGGRTYGWVASEYLSETVSGSPTAFNNALGVRVTDGPVNLRYSDGLDLPVMTTRPTGAEMPTLGYPVEFQDGYWWVIVEIDGGQAMAWVATPYLEPLNYVPVDTGEGDGGDSGASIWDFDGVDSAWVSDGPLNIRADASTSADIVFTLDTGDYVFGVEIVYSGNEPIWSDGHYWIWATAAGYEGYLATDYLTPVQ